MNKIIKGVRLRLCGAGRS